MTIEQMKQTLRGEPFRPFWIVTANDRRYFVPHPDFVSMHPKGGRTLIVHDADNAERSAILDLLLVSSIEFGASPNGENGQSGASM